MKINLKPKAVVLGSSLSTARFTVCMALISSLFFLWGLSYGLLDTLNKHFQNLFGITKSESAGIQGAYFGAYFVFAIPASFLLRKFGYKIGIIGGLILFSIGAICFWPTAEAELYPGFLACTFVIACGITTLEVGANGYICVLGGQKRASLYLTLAQGFNGISTFAGPLIASRWFFTGESSSSFATVQYVYLAVACIGVALALLFAFVTLPEVRQDTTPEQDAYVKEHGYLALFKRKRLMFGFAAELLYTGAQVAVASLSINYFVESHGSTDAEGANLFAYCQMAFMAGRFLSVPILVYVHPPLILGIYGTFACIFAILVSQLEGTAGTFCLFAVFFFESVGYPIIFAEGTLGLGPYQKYGSAFLVMGVSGGAWYPYAQATLADAISTKFSYIAPAIGFAAVAAYGFGLWIDSCRTHGFHYRVLEITEKEMESTLSDVASRVSDESKNERGGSSIDGDIEVKQAGKSEVVEIENVKN